MFNSFEISKLIKIYKTKVIIDLFLKGTNCENFYGQGLTTKSKTTENVSHDVAITHNLTQNTVTSTILLNRSTTNSELATSNEENASIFNIEIKTLSFKIKTTTSATLNQTIELSPFTTKKLPYKINRADVTKNKNNQIFLYALIIQLFINK